MPAIVTVTFSPCIDKSTAVSRLIADVKLKCAAPVFEPGGGGINVARAIKKLGGEALALYPAGGCTGKFFTALLQKEGVDTRVVASVHDTRENIILLETATNRQYRLGMPGTALTGQEWAAMLQQLEAIKDAAFIVASGSIPPGAPCDLFTRIAGIAKKNKAKLIADTSGAPLKQAIAGGAFLVKPNLGELCALLGKDFLDKEDVAAAAAQVLKNTECRAVAVSMGSEGALLVTAGTAVRFIPPEVDRKSTVGAGDSMVAGIVFKLSAGADIESAVKFGVACGTAATLNPGTELCKRADADRIHAKLHSFPL